MFKMSNVYPLRRLTTNVTNKIKIPWFVVKLWLCYTNHSLTMVFVVKLVIQMVIHPPKNMVTLLL